MAPERRGVPKANLVFRTKVHYADGAVAEVVVWAVQSPVPGSTHLYKYRLYFGRGGVRLIGYDNERGKGDHVHRFGVEMPYLFRSVEQLVLEFQADVSRLRGES